MRASGHDGERAKAGNQYLIGYRIAIRKHELRAVLNAQRGRREGASRNGNAAAWNLNLTGSDNRERSAREHGILRGIEYNLDDIGAKQER